MLKSSLKGSTILAAMALISSPAFAQVEEITVTAQRREESLQKVPVAVSAFTAESLQNRQVNDAQDLQRVVPSLKMTNNITTPTNLSPSLRGSTVQDASLVVAESPFGIYVDDVYLGRLNGNNVALADVERVEVLRGPQGTLYGRNTLAGAIKFITRTPGDQSWFNASAGYGNYNQYKVSLSAGGALGDNNLSGSIAAQANGKDGEFTNLATKQDVGKERNWAVRGKLHYTGSDAFDAVASLSYTKSNNDALQLIPGTTPTVPAGRQFTSDQVVPTYGYYTINRAPVASRATGIAAEPFEEGKQLIASLNMSYDLGNAKLRSITGFVNTKDDFTSDFGGNGLIMTGSTSNSDQFTEELQLQGNAFDGRFDYLVGAYYLHEASTQTFAWQFYTPSSTSAFNSKTNSIAFFTQGSYKITDDLKATAGVRWNRDSKTFNMSFIHLPSAIVPGASGTQALKNAYAAATPKFSLDYSIPTSGFVDSALIYASVARGFKSGGYNGIMIFDYNEGGQPYFPEKNWTYEAGLKTDLIEKRLRINAAYFINRINDLQLNATVNLPGGASVFPTQNAGNSTIKGLELEITATPVDNLTLFANSAFMTGHYRSYRTGSSAANAAASYGVAVPPQVPKYTFTVGFDYGIPVSLGAREGKINFGIDWFRTGKYFVAAANDFIVSPYSRLNGFVGLEIDSRWDVRLSVKNIEDKHTINSGSLSLGGFIIQPPREVMGTISYKM